MRCWIVQCDFRGVCYELTRARLKIAVIHARTEILDKLSLREHSAEGRFSFDIKSSGEPHVAPDAWLPTLVVSPDLTHDTCSTWFEVNDRAIPVQHSSQFRWYGGQALQRVFFQIPEIRIQEEVRR